MQRELDTGCTGGVLDAVYGGQTLARGVVLASLADENDFALATWGGQWFAFDVVEISSRPTMLFARAVRHPVT